MNGIEAANSGTTTLRFLTINVPGDHYFDHSDHYFDHDDHHFDDRSVKNAPEMNELTILAEAENFSPSRPQRPTFAKIKTYLLLHLTQSCKK